MLESKTIYVDRTEKTFNLLKKETTLTICPRRFGKSVFLTTIKAFYELKLEWWLRHGPNLWITKHMKKRIDYDNLSEE